MINSCKASNALSGKTVRACDGCLGKRARWFCGADDAFLCQGCDASVHSANNLASRHERVRLQSSTSSPPSKIVKTSNDERSPPAWHGGFTRKARTPRSQNSNNCKPNSRKLLVEDSDVQERMFINNPLALVPEIGCEDDGRYMMGEFETEEQMICKVPVFDPFSNEDKSSPRVVDVNYGEELLGTCDDELDLDVLPAGFLPSDVDLAEFAADVENLLGLDHEEDYFNSDGVIQEMVCGDGVRVKDEVQEIADEGFHEMSRSGSLMLDWNLEVDGAVKEEGMKGSSVSLTLNYDAVISAWDNQRSSPWTTGSRPDLNPHYWSHCSLGTFPKDGALYGGGLGQVGGKGDGEREARVLRYKEKRRTRLFSKKIRYEVRKLNAEKRPRMKGRFVKRTPSSFQLGTSSFPNYLTTK